MLELLKEEEIDFELTALALREAVMAYYKDYIGGRYVSNDHIFLRRENGQGGRWSDRRENELHAVTHVYVGDVRFATMSKSPDKMVFHDVADESYKKLREATLATVRLYLPNVEV